MGDTAAVAAAKQLDPHGFTAIMCAAGSRLPKVDTFTVARQLLEHGADPTQALVPALWNTGDEFPAFGQAALEHGADPDRATADSQLLLNNLIRWGRLKPAFWLLDHGAGPDDSTLQQAQSRGNKRMLERLTSA